MKKNLFGGILIGANLVLAAFLIMAASSTPASTTNSTPEKVVEAPTSSEPFIGQIIMFGGNFAPRGWAKCEGQLLPISRYSALFSILGTTYGGDGRTTFGLPDLRGRVAIGDGNSPGLSDYRLGSKGGSENVTLTTNQIPSHNHSYTNDVVKISPMPATSSQPTGYLGATNNLNIFANPSGGNASNNTNNTGGQQSFDIRQPYQTVNYIIALQGTFPSRS
jgi:microcystin-dependent protein